MGRWISQVKFANVKPRQISSLNRRFDLNHRQFGMYKLDEIVSIRSQISDQLLPPGFAIAIGRFTGDITNWVSHCSHSAHHTNKTPSQCIIWNDCKGCTEARQIVGFARRNKRNASVGQTRIEHTSRTMSQRRIKNQIAMNFVRTQIKIVTKAKFSKEV